MKCPLDIYNKNPEKIQQKGKIPMICKVCKARMEYYAVSKTGTWYKCPACKCVEHKNSSPDDPVCSVCRGRHPSDDRHPTE